MVKRSHTKTKTNTKKNTYFFLNENVGEFSGVKKKAKKKKKQENGPLAENDKTERAIGLGRKTREEIGNGNQITALRFRPDRTPVSSP